MLCSLSNRQNHEQNKGPSLQSATGQPAPSKLDERGQYGDPLVDRPFQRHRETEYVTMLATGGIGFAFATLSLLSRDVSEKPSEVKPSHGSAIANCASIASFRPHHPSILPSSPVCGRVLSPISPIFVKSAKRQIPPATLPVIGPFSLLAVKPTGPRSRDVWKIAGGRGGLCDPHLGPC